MAVEAQVCPQCGAAVQFGVGQTEVVCAHCGTTVVKAAAPGGSATSVEKELAAEKLIQETVGREKKLHSHGQPATAKIVSAQPTDIFRQTVEGRAVLMAFTVEVQPEGDGEAAFTAEAKTLVGLSAVDKYRPGTLLDVRYDPQNRAQVSVGGRHGVPSSNPEEQARQRQAKQQAKEQARRKEQPAQRAEPGANAAAAAPVGSAAWWQEQQAQRAQPGAAAATPAWGGPRPHGSVPVPVEFDKVTNLGPAAAVHEHQDQGISLIPHIGTPRPNRLVIYHDGLAFIAHGHEVHTWRWDEVAAIQSNVWFTGEHVILTEHEYTLIKTGGDKIILDDGVKDIEGALKSIKRAVFARLLPPLAQAYGAGQAVAFGPVTVHQQSGIQLDGKPYAWDTILEIKAERGRLAVTLRDSKKHEVRVNAIPNIELLATLIGLEYSENAYY